MNDPAAPATRYDVLVLGAGAAGLAAARALCEQGRRVAVVEARDRSGGRIFTRHVPSPAGDGSVIPVELGAEFVHGLPLESWRLIREAELETYELDGSMLSFVDGRLKPAQQALGAASVLDRMTEWLARQSPGTDETFEHYLSHTELPATQRRDAVRYVEGFNAADHRVIGVAALAKQQQAEECIEADRVFRLRAGYDAVPIFLQRRIVAGGGALFFNRPVSIIEWRPGNVRMRGVDPTGHAFEYEADRAVITLPLGVLQAGSVRIDPEPSRTLSAARRMAMGPVIRVPLVFHTRFWQSQAAIAANPGAAVQLQDLSFLFTDGCLPATWWTPNPNEAPLLTGWTAGARVRELVEAAAAGLKDRCLATLARIFNLPLTSLVRELASWHFHDWSADPWARGAYSYAPAGALDASAKIAEPVDGTLYFAGEHCNVLGHWGTVHGALQSGAAAAAEIALAAQA